MMEYKLAKVIMSPAMMATWIFGLCLVSTPGLSIGAMYGHGQRAQRDCHDCVSYLADAPHEGFQRGENTCTGRQYRMMNEVPTVLMIVIVFSVTVKF